MANSVNIIPASVEKLVLKVDGAEYKVSSYVSRWSVNQIPSCTLDLAIGVDANNNKEAKVHGEGANSLKIRSKAEVILEMAGKKNLSKGWGGGGKGKGVIFEGYIHALQPIRSTSQVSVRVTLYHWLSDLNTSHFGFGRFAPNTPWSIFKENPITSPFGGTAGLFRGDGSGGYKAFDPSDIYQKDIYGMFVEAMIFSLKDTRHLRSYRHSIEAFQEDCLKALERLENLGCQLRSSIGPSKEAALDTQQINQIMGAIAHNNHGGSTAWSKLLAFCSHFDLQIIPAATTAYVAPKLSGSTDAGVEIFNTDVDLGSGSGFQANMPRGVVMVPNKAAFPRFGKVPAGCDGLNTEVMGIYTIPPNYDGTNIAGAIEVIPSPPIFSADSMFPATLDSSPPDQNDQQQPDSEVVEGLRPGDPDCPPTNIFADALCKSYYWNYVFSSRFQTIDCALRFDITPGTVVKVNIAQASVKDSKLAALAGFEGNTIYGVAETIIYQISAEEKKISTQIVVRYVKSEEDKKSYESISEANKHPLFESYYGNPKNKRPMSESLK